MLGLPLCHAETSEALALQKVLSAKSATDSTNDPKWRASLAAVLHRYCESILLQVPRNAPQEDLWVHDEYREIKNLTSASIASTSLTTMNDLSQKSDLRFKRLRNSVENARYELRNYFSDCSKNTAKLMESKQASPAAEALLWVRLSGFFSGEDELWRVADIIGLVSKKDCQFFRSQISEDVFDAAAVKDENNLCSVRWISDSVIVRAVIPLLEGQ
jgi:hypothetical protein